MSPEEEEAAAAALAAMKEGDAGGSGCAEAGQDVRVHGNMQGSREIALAVVDEVDNDTLLLHHITSDNIYKKQKETIISWKDPEKALDLLLSFQEAEGCAYIWQSIDDLQKKLQSDDGYGLKDLPSLELSSLPSLLKTVLEWGTKDGTHVAELISQNDDCFPKLVDLFRTCGDSRNMDGLHMIFRLVKGIISLNNPDIFHKIFSDDFILDIIGALEYDPEVPNVKSHREFMRNQTLNEDIHIGNVSVASKIRQTYIIVYIKEVILLNALDGPTVSSLNSIIKLNKTFVVSVLKDDASFIQDLIARIISSNTSAESKGKLILFLSELCFLSKSLVPNGPSQLSSQLSRDLTDKGALNMISDVLQSQHKELFSAGANILEYFVDLHPDLVRTFVANHEENYLEGNSLLDFLVQGMIIDSEEMIHQSCLRKLLGSSNTVKDHGSYYRTNSDTRSSALKFDPKLEQKIKNVEKVLQNCAVRLSIRSNSKRLFSTSTLNIGNLLPELHENGNEFALNVIQDLLQEADEEVVIENHAVVSLDGTDEDILRSYVLAVIKFRLWNQLRGGYVDFFHFLVKYNGRALDLAFDGKESWLKAVLNDQEGSFQFRPSDGVDAYIPSRKCHILPFVGEYHKIAPNSKPGEIPLGVQNLKIAFCRAISCDGQSETPGLNIALGTFVVYFGESPKFHKIFRACATSLIDTSILSLNCYDPNLGVMVRFWGKLSKILVGSMLNAVIEAHKAGMNAKVPGVAMDEDNLGVKKFGLPSINTLQDVLDNICYFNYNSMRPSNPAIQKYIRLPKNGSVTFHPIDSTLVNAEDKCVTEFRVRCHQMLGMQYQKPTLPMDSEVCPDLQNRFLMDFYYRNRAGVFRPNAWSSDKLVQQHHCGVSILENLARSGRSTIPSVPVRSFTGRSFKTGLPTGMLASLAKRGLNMLKLR